MNRPSKHASAFTLIEVMIAAGILFMCLFAILALVSNALRNARALQRPPVDASAAAAQLYTQFTTTNRVSEGSGSGDFGDAYPGYSYTYDLTEIATNKLCQLDVTVREGSDPNAPKSKVTLLLYLPNLQGGSLDPGTHFR